MEFKIINNTSEAVLLEVIFSDAIDKMSQKGFSGREKYIKYTKGKNNNITVYDENNIGYLSFNFGDSGFTLISEDVECLKDKVYKFLLKQHIQPKKMTDKIESKLKIMPPIYGLGLANHYCVHLGGEFAIFLKTEDEIKETFGEYEVYKTYIASTGVTVHEAKFK